MAATPQFGTMIFRGLRSGMTYTKDVYLSDVNAAPIRFDSGGGASATSETSWTPPEPVMLIDYAQVTGTVDTTKIAMTRNGQNTGDILRYTIHLTSLATRPSLAIPFPGASKIAANQLT